MRKRNIKILFSIIIIFILASIIYILYNVLIKPDVIVGAGFEQAYVMWKDKDKTSNYNVYIKRVDSTEFEIIDKSLIREDKNGYMRADVVGLEEGDYQFKIELTVDENREKTENVNNDEMQDTSIITDVIQVKENVREGFSFSKNSTTGGKSSGGYLENGQVPEDAKILYVTNENINNITLDITKSNGDKKIAKGLCEILKNWNEEALSKHLIIRIIGKIERENIEGLQEEYKAILVENCNDITIEGIGNSATLKGTGIIISNSSNIEIRNLGFMLYYEDAISIENNSNNIWIHNNDIFYGESREGDKAKGDGAVDIKKSEYVTISYNHFWDNGKTSLCGIDKDVNYVTYHHNWFDHCDSRCPRVYGASVHCYNNYYDGVSQYCVAAVDNASIFLESNYFKSSKYPMIAVGQGSDYLYNIISEDYAGGIIKSYGNTVKNAKRMIYAQSDSKNFDAYLVENKTDIIPAEYKTIKGNYSYNNFDTNKDIIYEYNVHDAYEAKEIAIKEAGRLQNGDIKFNTKKLSNISHKRTDFMEKMLDKLLANY